jgi:hypothetical protein
METVDMSAITVLRVPASLGGTARRYKVHIDGVERGRLAAGEEIAVEVPSGSHEVQVRIDWTGSALVTVTLGEGETASFAVAPAADTQFGQFKAIFRRQGYLNLTRVSSEI